MGMFDWYRPAQEFHCPACGGALSEWQGYDGDCALFVWQQGVRHPIGHAIDDPEVRLASDQLTNFTLPHEFMILCHDCPAHQPIGAYCSTNDEGTWMATRLMPYDIRLFDTHSRAFRGWLKNG